MAHKTIHFGWLENGNLADSNLTAIYNWILICLPNEFPKKVKKRKAKPIATIFHKIKTITVTTKTVNKGHFGHPYRSQISK